MSFQLSSPNELMWAALTSPSNNVWHHTQCWQLGKLTRAIVSKFLLFFFFHIGTTNHLCGCPQSAAPPNVKLIPWGPSPTFSQKSILLVWIIWYDPKSPSRQRPSYQAKYYSGLEATSQVPGKSQTFLWARLILY